MIGPVGAPFPVPTASRRDVAMARKRGRKATIVGEGWTLTAHHWRGVIYITTIRKSAKKGKP